MLNRTKTERLACLSSFLFILVLIWIVYFKLGNIELIREVFSRIGHLSLKERFLFDIEPFLFEYNQKMELHDAILNSLILVPLGILLPVCDGLLRPLKHLGICALLTIAIEFTQLFTRIGGFATDDLITNVLGCLIGFILYLPLSLLPERTKNAALYLTILILSVTLTYAIVTLIPVLPDYLALIRTPTPTP